MPRRPNKRKNQKIKEEENTQEDLNQQGVQQSAILKDKNKQAKLWGGIKSSKQQPQFNESYLDEQAQEVLKENNLIIQHFKKLLKEKTYFKDAENSKYIKQTTKVYSPQRQYLQEQVDKQNLVLDKQILVLDKTQQSIFLDHKDIENQQRQLQSQNQIQSQTLKGLATGFQIQDQISKNSSNQLAKRKSEELSCLDLAEFSLTSIPCKKLKTSQDNLQSAFLQCYETFKNHFLQQILSHDNNKAYKKPKKKITTRNQSVQCKLSPEPLQQQNKTKAFQKTQVQTQTSDSLSFFAGNQNIDGKIDKNGLHTSKQYALSHGIGNTWEKQNNKNQILRQGGDLEPQTSTESIGGGVMLKTPTFFSKSNMQQEVDQQPTINILRQSSDSVIVQGQKKDKTIQQMGKQNTELTAFASQNSVDQDQSVMKSAARNKICRYLNTLDNISEEEQSPTQSLQDQKLKQDNFQQNENNKGKQQNADDTQKLDFEFQTPKASNYDTYEPKFKLFQKFQVHDSQNNPKLENNKNGSLQLNDTIHQSLEVLTSKKLPGSAQKGKTNALTMQLPVDPVTDEKNKRNLQIQINNNVTQNQVTPTTQTSRSALDYNCDLLTVDYKRSTEFSAWANNYDYLLEDIRYLFDEDNQGDYQHGGNSQYLKSSQKEVSPKKLQFHRKTNSQLPTQTQSGQQDLLFGLIKQEDSFDIVVDQENKSNNQNNLNQSQVIQISIEDNILEVGVSQLNENLDAPNINDNHLMRPNQEELTMQDINNTLRDKPLQNKITQPNNFQESINKLEDLKSAGQIKKGDYDKMKTIWHTVENLDQAIKEDENTENLSYLSCNDQSEFQSFDGAKRSQVFNVLKTDTENPQKRKNTDIVTGEQGTAPAKSGIDQKVSQLTQKQLEFQQQLESLKSKPNQNILNSKLEQPHKFKWESKIDEIEPPKIQVKADQAQETKPQLEKDQQQISTQPQSQPQSQAQNHTSKQIQPGGQTNNDWTHLTSNKFFKNQEVNKAAPQNEKKFFQSNNQQDAGKPKGFLQTTEEDKQINQSALKKRPANQNDKNVQQPPLKNQKIEHSQPENSCMQQPTSAVKNKTRFQNLITNVTSFIQPQSQPESYLAKNNQNKPKVKALEVAKQAKIKEQQKQEEKKIQLNQKKVAQQQQSQQQQSQQQINQQQAQPQVKSNFNFTNYNNKFLKTNQQQNQNQQGNQQVKKNFFFKTNNTQNEKVNNQNQVNLQLGANGLLKQISNPTLLQSQAQNSQVQQTLNQAKETQQAINQPSSAQKNQLKWKPIFKAAEDKENIPKQNISKPQNQFLTQPQAQPLPKPQPQSQQIQTQTSQTMEQLTKTYQNLQLEMHGVPSNNTAQQVLQTPQGNVNPNLNPNLNPSNKVLGTILQPNNNILNQAGPQANQLHKYSNMKIKVEESGNFSQFGKQSMTTQYEISPYRDSDEEDDEEYERFNQLRQMKKVPKWADMENVRRQLAHQEKQYDPDQIFYNPGPYTIDLKEIFGKNKKDWKQLENDPRQFNLNMAQYDRRTSSGNWNLDRVTSKEQMMYRLYCGYQ